MARINRAVWLASILLACAGTIEAQEKVAVEAGTVERCVFSGEGLQAALLAAAGNGQHDIIRLVQGGWYHGSFSYDSTEVFNLTIDGGYNGDCTSRVVDPANTVFDSSLGLHTDQAARFVIEGLTVQNAGGVTAQTAGEVVLSRDVLKYNTRGAYLTAATATIRDSTIEYNANPVSAGGLFINASTVTLTGNQIRNNEALWAGGIEIQCSVDWIRCNGTVTLTNNVIENNSCSFFGAHGAARLSHDEVLFQNNLIVGNYAYWNGGVYISANQVTFVNNVIAGNWDGDGYSQNYIQGTHIYFINNTVTRNSGNLRLDGEKRADIYNNIFFEQRGYYGDDLSVSYGENQVVRLFNNDFDHATAGVPRPIHPSNLDKVDPLFATGGWRPQPGSPVINGGSNTAPKMPAKDIDGHPRIQGGRVDMGAYESATSPPGAPRNPSPANGATGILLEPTLTWTKGARAASHDVYFGLTSPPPFVRNTTGTSFTPGTLITNKTHYWRIVAKNDLGTAPSPTWSFKTGNLGATNPSPHDGAIGVSLNPTLSWKAGLGANSYDVYFGTWPPPPKAGSVTGTSYDPGTLAANKTYYWKVVTRMGSNSLSSPIWTFKTK